MHCPDPGRASAAHPAKEPVAYPAPGSAAAPAAYPPYVRQRGAVLAVSLIFLLLLSILAISVMRSGQLEVLMAGNSQARLDAFQLAEGIADGVLARWEDNLDTEAIVCSNGHPDPDGDCDRTDLVWDQRLDPSGTDPDLLPAVADATVVSRARPLNDGEPGCVPAFITGIAHGTWAFFFDVDAAFDNTEVRQGASRVNRGAVVINPVSSDCFANPPIGNLDKYAHVPVTPPPVGP